ncbi:MAG: hypothetical protein K6F20_06235 [Bacteroidaceae bacterium]|nr:hypothetical protein [Bacteroidaceae bacterium]
MKQTLPNYIKQNEDLRKVLLSQDGGIMKYWAEHPDADFDVDLFVAYENEIVNAYLQANKQNRSVRSLPKDELRRRSLDWYQSKESELKFFVDLKPALNTFDTEVPKEILNCIEIYLADAYKESHRCKYPEGMSPQDFYNKVIEIYGPFGLALDCLERVLQECRGKAVKLTVKHFFLNVIAQQGGTPEWDEVNNLQAEFDMRMFRQTFYAEGSYKKLRQAVEEIIENSTQKLTGEESRKVCREMAKDEMRKFNQFTRWVNNETYPMEKSEGEKFVPLITPEERHWLRNIMYENSPGATRKEELTTMRRYYCNFIHILQHIGTIWAAQLLVRGIDMKELEKETGIILSRLPDSMYYVDRYFDDRRGDCCVYDWSEAKDLLSKIKTAEEHQNDFYNVSTERQTEQEIPSAPKRKSAKSIIPRTIPKPPKYMTLKYIRHDKSKAIVEIQNKRVALLYKKWQTGNNNSKDGGCWGWLSPEVTLDDFSLFFEGKDMCCNLKFAANKTILSVFLDRLLNYRISTSNGNMQTTLIIKQTKQSASKLVLEQFNTTPNFNSKERLKALDISRIKESIYILDYTVTLPHLKNGYDNDFDESDTTLMLASSNIDLGIKPRANIEQAIKSGMLREGKHT